MEALAAAYRPGRTFAQTFAEFYSRVFSAQGLLVLDAGGRAMHRMGAPVLRAAIERADELHLALVERNQELEAAGYHAQVAVGAQSSLLFLIDERSGARRSPEADPPSAAEPDGLWQAGRQSYSTAELLAILEAEPERISPSALLRPVFPGFSALGFGHCRRAGGDCLLCAMGRAYERILGPVTPALPRFSGTLVEPAIGALLSQHGLKLDEVFAETAASLASRLAERAMPVEEKRSWTRRARRWKPS